jgi:hypothetical protein
MGRRAHSTRRRELVRLDQPTCPAPPSTTNSQRTSEKAFTPDTQGRTGSSGVSAPVALTLAIRPRSLSTVWNVTPVGDS